MSQPLLTISQLAKYVGVTVRAVRHYHAIGLLPEPPRDSSGYRRYGADAVIELTRIKTLADAGVPLAQIETLPQASAETFTAVIDSIKSDITKRIAELALAKERLSTLQSGERMFVSEAVADYLNALRRIGLSEAIVSFERDAWILVSALHPAYVDTWVTQKKEMIIQPDVASLYRRLDEARNWSVVDPRLRELAKDIIRFSSRYQTPSIVGQDELITNKQTFSLINDYGADAFPAWRQLEDKIKELSNS